MTQQPSSHNVAALMKLYERNVVRSKVAPYHHAIPLFQDQVQKCVFVFRTIGGAALCGSPAQLVKFSPRSPLVINARS